MTDEAISPDTLATVADTPKDTYRFLLRHGALDHAAFSDRDAQRFMSWMQGRFPGHVGYEVEFKPVEGKLEETRYPHDITIDFDSVGGLHATVKCSGSLQPECMKAVEEYDQREQRRRSAVPDSVVLG